MKSHGSFYILNMHDGTSDLKRRGISARQASDDSEIATRTEKLTLCELVRVRVRWAVRGRAR